jgi:IS5 family transposase
MSLLELFYQIDEFCQQFLPAWQKQQLADGHRKRNRASRLCQSEIITLLVLFQQSGYRNFKVFYLLHVWVYLRADFPGLLSYSRFVELVPAALVPLSEYLKTCLGECSGVSYVDSTPLRVCHNARIHSHKVFLGQAARGKTSTGWFFGFKLHLVINEAGEIIALTLTPGNVDDRTPLPKLAADLFGKLFGDKGYLSQPLTESLLKTGLTLITRRRKNMKNQAPLLPLLDALLLRKRGLIDSVIGQLKHKEQIEHSRHRRWTGFLANLLAGLIAYCLRDNKPSIVQKYRQITPA